MDEFTHCTKCKHTMRKCRCDFGKGIKPVKEKIEAKLYESNRGFHDNGLGCIWLTYYMPGNNEFRIYLRKDSGRAYLRFLEQNMLTPEHMEEALRVLKEVHKPFDEEGLLDE